MKKDCKPNNKFQQRGYQSIYKIKRQTSRLVIPKYEN